MRHILIVEDEPRVAEVLQKGLEENGYNTTVAYDGDMAFRLFQAREFDLIISDIVLPKMNGLDLCQAIHRLNHTIPILMLTALGTTDDKLQGFDATADDYMTKPFDFRELLARVKALLKRNGPLAPAAPTTLVYDDLVVDRDMHQVTRNNTLIHLSPKEYNLLVYMLENKEKVISRREIAEKVWNTHFDTGTNFIDVYINYLRKKIDRNFATKLIHTKPGVGFVLSNKLP